MATIESYRLHEAKKLIDEAYERIHDAYNRYNPTNKSQPDSSIAIEALRQAQTRLTNAISHLEAVADQVASQI